MKKILIISFCFFCLFGYSQRAEITKTPEIKWLSIEQAQEYSAKYKMNIMIYFYRNNCDYCKLMKEQTLKDPEVIKFINENFYPVYLDARSKDTIVFNKKKYYNQQPTEHGHTFRHDLFGKLYTELKNNPGYIFPTTIIIDHNYNKVNQLTGIQKKLQFLRNLKKSVD